MNRRSFLRQSGAFAGLGLAGLAGCGRRESARAAGRLSRYGRMWIGSSERLYA